MFRELFDQYVEGCIQRLETTEDDLLREDMKVIKKVLGDAYEYELSQFIYAFTLSGFGGAMNGEDEHDIIAQTIHELIDYYKQLCRIYTFRVSVIGQEEHVWRDIFMPAQATLADLGYAILATMNADGSHLFRIRHKKDDYYCDAMMDEDFLIDYASDVSLKDLKLNKRSKLVMEYDYGESYQFNIQVTDIEKTKTLPYFDVIAIDDGEGYGILEDAHFVFDAYYEGNNEIVKEYLYHYDEEQCPLDLPFDIDRHNATILLDMEAFKNMYTTMYDNEDDDFDLEDPTDLEISDEGWFN